VGLESATYISQLVQTYPLTTDPKQQGDDHITLIKKVLQNTFPNAARAIYFPDSSIKSASFSALATQMNVTFLVDTTAGDVIATMPSLTASDAGWQCHVMKTSLDANAIFITPPSGTVQSGPLLLTKTRRGIPGVPCRVVWTGSSWIAERAERTPVGSLIDNELATIPVGYVLPNGQTLAGTAGSVFPDYFAAKGSLVTRDLTGRIVAMKEAIATRLTVAGSGIDGALLGAIGGLENHVLSVPQIPAHNHTLTDPGHTHTEDGIQGGPNISGGGGFAHAAQNTSLAFTGVSIAPAGGGLAHNNTQPTIVLNKILVVE
jgi:hypothetical protein